MSEAIDPKAIEESTVIKQLFIFEHQPDNSYKKSLVNLAKKIELNAFLIKNCQITLTSNSKQEHKFNDDSEVASLIDDLLNDINKSDETVQCIADKLSDSENQTVKEGTFIIARVTSNNRDSFILTKLDFESYFSKKNFELTEGLPEEKGILKSCLINIKNNKREEIIFLSDRNGSISQFWNEKFLHSSSINQDIDNTKKSYKMIIDTLKTNLSNRSLLDLNELVESTNTYYSTNTSFDFDDFVTKNIMSFTPNDKSINMSDISESLKKAKERRKCDGKFNIVLSEIRKKFKKTIILDEGMELTTFGSVKDKVFTSKIKGKTYLIIDTKQGLENFEERRL